MGLVGGLANRHCERIWEATGLTGYGPFWSRKGVMFVRADDTTIGPSESLPQIKARGYGWVAFDPTTGEWPDERRLAVLYGLDVVAWTRIRNPSDLGNLLLAKRRWQAKATIPNIEIGIGDGFGDTRDPTLMGATLVHMSTAGTSLLITDGWADPIGKWKGYRRWVGSVECFPEDAPAYIDVNGCVRHASAFFRAVVPALGAYGTTQLGRLPVRSDYNWPLEKPWIVYPGDSVADWKNW